MVRISASPAQLRKLRKGLKVRVKPAMEGSGVSMIVNPANYQLLTRAFTRNKGADVTLSDLELQANQEEAPAMKGSGIFGKSFDRLVKRTIGKKATRALYGLAEAYLPLAQAGLTGGLTAAGAALGTVQPELIPFIAPSVIGLSTLGSDYLANPSKYQFDSKKGGSRAKLAKDLAGRYLQDQALQKLNAELGTNMGSLDRASLGKAVSDKATAELKRLTAEAKSNIPANKPGDTTYDEILKDPNRSFNFFTDPLLVGSGLYASPQGRGCGCGVKKRRMNGGSIGVNGTILTNEHPATKSQPYSANFFLANQMVPAYQKFSKGMGLYI